MRITERELRGFIRAALIRERRMASPVMSIVTRAIAAGPKTHQELLAHVLADHPSMSDEEIDDHIDTLEDEGAIIWDPTAQAYK